MGNNVGKAGMENTFVYTIFFFTFKLSTSGKVVLERDRFATYCAKSNLELTRVARWFVFKPKIQIWVNFGGSCKGRC
jgi:hypothetical protein